MDMYRTDTQTYLAGEGARPTMYAYPSGGLWHAACVGPYGPIPLGMYWERSDAERALSLMASVTTYTGDAEPDDALDADTREWLCAR